MSPPGSGVLSATSPNASGWSAKSKSDGCISKGCWEPPPTLSWPWMLAIGSWNGTRAQRGCSDGSPAEVLTARLQENLEARNAREGRRYKLSLSVGLARYDPERPCPIDELLAQADRAMYEQKRGDTPR